jgi:hypothetical protein
LGRTRRAARRGVRPAVLGASLLYAAALYAAGLNADLLDVQASWWVVTVAAVLLLSPLYHGFVIRWAAADKGRPKSVGATILATFPQLFVGQLLVGAGVVLGAFALLVPGIYVGVRAILYKQAIVLGGRAPVAALRDSFRRTAAVRTTGLAALALAAFYGVALGVDALFTLVGSAIVGGIASVVVSGTLLAMLNSLLTDLYVSRSEERPMESRGGDA